MTTRPRDILFCYDEHTGEFKGGAIYDWDIERGIMHAARPIDEDGLPGVLEKINADTQVAYNLAAVKLQGCDQQLENAKAQFEAAKEHIGKVEEIANLQAQAINELQQTITRQAQRIGELEGHNATLALTINEKNDLINQLNETADINEAMLADALAKLAPAEA